MRSAGDDGHAAGAASGRGRLTRRLWRCAASPTRWPPGAGRWPACRWGSVRLAAEHRAAADGGRRRSGAVEVERRAFAGGQRLGDGHRGRLGHADVRPCVWRRSERCRSEHCVRSPFDGASVGLGRGRASADGGPSRFGSRPRKPAIPPVEAPSLPSRVLPISRRGLRSRRLRSSWTSLSDCNSATCRRSSSSSGPISFCSWACAPCAMLRTFFNESTVHCTATGIRSGPSTNMPTSTMMMICPHERPNTRPPPRGTHGHSVLRLAPDGPEDREPDWYPAGLRRCGQPTEACGELGLLMLRSWVPG